MVVVSVSFQPSEGVTPGSIARLPRISRLAKGETEKTASRLATELGHFLHAFCTPLGLVSSVQTSEYTNKLSSGKITGQQMYRRLGVIGKDTVEEWKGLNC